MPDLNDKERVALLTSRLGLPEGALDAGLALQALRHGSYVHERSLAAGREQLRSNERLEFLGDAVLGFLVARRFYHLLPAAPEGELTRLRASVVREESLALAARALGLGELLLLGRGEQRSGGRENAGRLADAFEAVLAAVYLSRGMDRAQEVVERLLAPLFEQSSGLARDPKTELQQLCQSRRRVPQYQVLNVSGPDHARAYEVEVRLDGTQLGRGSGKSKKEAEQAAARVALEDPAALERALLDEPVTLAPADPAWAEAANDEMARLEGVLPDAQVEHVGSTAVPGLEARPVIDLMVAVVDPAALPRIPDYEPCGEAGVPGRLLFRKRNATAFNLEVVQAGSERFREAIALREFLRAHPEEAARYAAAKREAVGSGATTLLRYAEAMAGEIPRLLRNVQNL